MNKKGDSETIFDDEQSNETSPLIHNFI